MMDCFLKWIGIGAIVWVVAYPVLFRPPYDSTDNPPERSQMRLHTDAATGCQYLSARSGGITPRLSPEGNHMGCHHD